MKFLDIVVFGKTSRDMAEALEHAANQLRMGTPSESISFDDGSHVTFDIRTVKGNRELEEKYAAYIGE